MPIFTIEIVQGNRIDRRPHRRPDHAIRRRRPSIEARSWRIGRRSLGASCNNASPPITEQIADAHLAQKCSVGNRSPDRTAFRTRRALRRVDAVADSVRPSSSVTIGIHRYDLGASASVKSLPAAGTETIEHYESNWSTHGRRPQRPSGRADHCAPEIMPARARAAVDRRPKSPSFVRRPGAIGLVMSSSGKATATDPRPSHRVRRPQTAGRRRRMIYHFARFPGMPTNCSPLPSSRPAFTVSSSDDGTGKPADRKMVEHHHRRRRLVRDPSATPLDRGSRSSRRLRRRPRLRTTTGENDASILRRRDRRTGVHRRHHRSTSSTASSIHGGRSRP